MMAGLKKPEFRSPPCRGVAIGAGLEKGSHDRWGLKGTRARARARTHESHVRHCNAFAL